MSLFSGPRCVLWPHKESAELFFLTKDNNTFPFDINFWQLQSTADLLPINQFLKRNRITAIDILIPDDVIVTKSFIYDAKVDTIEKKEIADLAANSVNFDISPEAINFQLIPCGEKTIIQANITDLSKMNFFNQNLNLLGIRAKSLRTVSSALANVIASFHPGEYFILFPTNANEFLLSLSSGKSVYLTSHLKKSSLDIQKLVNYSKLYFSHLVSKIFLPANVDVEVNSTTNLDKTPYDPAQIAASFNKPTNLPLPVLGLLSFPSSPNPVIIKPMTNNINPTQPLSPEEGKRNLLPIIAVFVLTAAIASVVIWYLLDRGQTNDLTNPTTQTPTPIVDLLPTETPTPSIAEVSKAIKVQILNATGVNGQAAALKAIVTALGFSDITVGNSSEKVTANEIRLKSSLSTAQSYFENKLGKDFPATYSATLKESSAYDVIFIISTVLNANPTP